MILNEVIHDLYIGDLEAATQIAKNQSASEKENRGWHIVTVAIDSTFKGDQFFGFHDGPGNYEDILLHTISRVSTKYMELRTGVPPGKSIKKLLIHCIGGRSRSATIMLGVLCLVNHWSLDEAYKLLIEVHPKTRIHPHLSKLLIDCLDNNNIGAIPSQQS